MTGTTIRSSLFRDYGVATTVYSDLLTELAAVNASATSATAAATTATAAATTATAASASATSAASTAVAQVNTAASTAQTNLNAAVTTATTSISSSTAAAVTSASNAATSATAASTSATAAATSATPASTSATAAATSASGASTSATGASTSATNAATSATAAASSATAAGTSAANAATSQAAISGRNVLMNGSMRLWQRGTSFVVAPGGSPTFTADRWRVFHDGTGGTTTVSQVALTTASLLDVGLSYAMSYAVSVAATGGTVRQIIQPVEGVGTLAGRTATVSFYAFVASGTLVVPVSLSQVFGTGGSPSANVNTVVGSVTLTTTPTRYTLTVSVPSIFGKTLGTGGNDAVLVVFSPPLTGTYTMSLAGVQFEAGGLATSFEVKPLAVSLMECQRYYQTGSGAFWGTSSGTGSAIVGTVGLPVTMRGTPSVTSSFSASTNTTSPTVAAFGATAILVQAVSTGTNGYSLTCTFTTSSEL